MQGFKDQPLTAASRLSSALSAAALNYNRVNRTRRENLLISYGLTVEKYF